MKPKNIGLLYAAIAILSVVVVVCVIALQAKAKKLTPRQFLFVGQYTFSMKPNGDVVVIQGKAKKVDGQFNDKNWFKGYEPADTEPGVTATLDGVQD